MTNLAEQLKSERSRKGFTQSTLAKASGVSERTIQTAESGGSVSTETLLALGAVLDFDFCASRRSASELEFEHSLSRLRYPKDRISRRMWFLLACWVGLTTSGIAIVIAELPWFDAYPNLDRVIALLLAFWGGDCVLKALHESRENYDDEISELKPYAWTVFSGLKLGRRANLNTEQQGLLDDICGKDVIPPSHMTDAKA